MDLLRCFSVWRMRPRQFALPTILRSVHYLVQNLEAGAVFVNALVASDPRLPFGGIKRSGYGRELSEVGLREFGKIQTVWVK